MIYIDFSCTKSYSVLKWTLIVDFTINWMKLKCFSSLSINLSEFKKYSRSDQLLSLSSDVTIIAFTAAVVFGICESTDYRMAGLFSFMSNKVVLSVSAVATLAGGAMLLK